MTHDANYELSLQLSHPTADPATFTEALGLDCTGRRILAGEPRSTPKGTPLEGVYPRSHWSHRFQPREAVDLVSHVSSIVAQLEMASEFFRQHAADGGDAELFLGLFVDGNFDDILPAELLAQLGALGIDLRLDVYGREPSQYPESV